MPEKTHVENSVFVIILLGRLAFWGVTGYVPGLKQGDHRSTGGQEIC